MKRVITAMLAISVGMVFGCEKEAPRIDGINPAIGLMHGGEKVKISGAGLGVDNVATVYLGDYRVTKLSVAADDTIWVNTPEAGEPGKVDVRVVMSDGTQFLMPDGFEYMKHDKMAECVNISKQLNGTFEE